MGIIQKQATRNAVSIFLATIVGAVNTIVVLPAAFADYEEGWGLIKVIVAYALIFSQFVHAGIPNALIRFLPQTNETDRSVFLSRMLLVPVMGTLVFLLLLTLFGELGLGLVNAEERALLTGRIPELFVLTAALTFFHVFGGYLGALLKSTLYQFLSETFLKTWYLLVVLGFWFGWYEFNVLLWSYIAGYVIAMLIALGAAYGSGLRIQLKGRFPFRPSEVATYSFYAILDRGAAIIVSNLDIIMIGFLASLEEVAFYTLAFYIGSVTLLPQKSISAISLSVVSSAIAGQENDKLFSVYRKSSLMQLTLGGLIFSSIWVPIDEMMLLLPEQFSGGKWVVFYIGIAKLLQMAGGVSGGILVYSEHYRTNFYLNSSLIGITIVSNIIFIHPKILNMGISGAALATAISALIYTVMKVVFVKRYFNIHPIDKLLLRSTGLIVACSMLAYLPTIEAHPFLGLLVKGGATALVFTLFARLFGVLPDVRTFLKH